MVASALLSAALVACGGGSASDASSTQGSTTTADVVGAVSLAVSGGPDLPLNGTTTQVTVALTPDVPTKVELSRDDLTPFATWPKDAFFTRSADGKTLTGAWCITSSCWNDTPGAHILKAVATYADGKTASSSVALNVADAAPTPPATAAPVTPVMPPPAGVEWTGMSAAMWTEINAQRSSFGDSNDCQARVNAIPTSGGVTLKPGADINAALASNSVVFLSGGTYKPTTRITVPAGKKLIGVAGQSVTIDASGVDYGVLVQNNAALANVIVDGANGDGVNFYYAPTDTGSTGALVYQVSARRSGFYNATGDGSAGIRVSQNATNNCVVSSEAFDTWNVLGAPNDNGGNSDGVNNSFGAHDNTFIDVHSYRNGDDGFDMWQGGISYWYFSASHDNGKTTGKALTGNGNGIKVGTGNASHKFYKTNATNNKTCGYVQNGNAQDPKLVQSTATGNPNGNYCYFTP